jgi:hypothetical protein
MMVRRGMRRRDSRYSRENLSVTGLTADTKTSTGVSDKLFPHLSREDTLNRLCY